MLTIDQLEEIRATKARKHEIEDAVLLEIILRIKAQQQPPTDMAEPAAPDARAGGVPARAQENWPFMSSTQMRVPEKPSATNGESKPKRRYAKRQAPAGAGSELLKAVMSVLEQPFNIDDLRTSVKAKMPQLLKERAGSFLSCTLERFQRQGFLQRSGTKNGRQAYVRGPEFKKPISEKEEAYREFRSTIQTTPSEV